MNVIFKDIQDRLLHRNQNYICAIVAQPGMGKSYVGLRLCEIISPRFNVDNVVFSAKDFLKLINGGKLQAGDAVLWDEMSIDAFSRDFAKLQNKLIVHVLTTFRTRNIFMCFSCPSLDFVDVGVRRLLHAVVEPIGLNREKQTNIIKFKRVKVNPISGFITYPFPRIKDELGRNVVVKQIELSKTSHSEAYENKRKGFADELARQVERDILHENDVEIKKKMTDADIIAIGNKEGLDWSSARKIQSRFGIARDRAYRIQDKVGCV